MADQILGAGRSTLNAYTDPRSTLFTGPNRDLGDVPFGAVPQLPDPVQNIDTSMMDGSNSSNNSSGELRVVIKVPTDYLSSFSTQGSSNGELSSIQGIIFPNTPTLTIEHKAAYTSLTPTHSNYAINFYKASSVEDISIAGVFTVQNDTDAQVYLSAVWLLRSLTKMRFSTDADAGSPPPICRLNAYGPQMLNNIPVGITSFRQDLPSDVDFYQLTSGSFGNHLVPTKATLTVNCKVMFSRAEMLGASVTSFLSGNGLGV
jgi:hypothetical protein